VSDSPIDSTVYLYIKSEVLQYKSNLISQPAWQPPRESREEEHYGEASPQIS
jgi:hypothetical protein